MPRKFFKETVLITTAATGLTFTSTISASFMRAKAMQMTLICPNYTTATPTTTISFTTPAGLTFFTDSARAENATYQVTLGAQVLEPGDIIIATLSGVAGGIHTITCIFHCEE